MIYNLIAALSFSICSAEETPASLIDLKLEQVSISTQYRKAHPLAKEAAAKVEAYRNIYPEKTVESDLDLACRRLTELRVEENLLSSRFGPKHPSIIRLKRKLDFLEKLTEIQYDEAYLSLLLKEKQAVRETLKSQYGPSHPKMTGVDNSIQFIQTTLKEIANKGGDDNSK